MIRSMTGFGGAATQADATHYAVELRSLNNKYFKASVRLPEELAALETELEAVLRKQVSRGSFTLTVKTKLNDAQSASRVNDAAVLTYLEHLEAIRHKVADQSVNIDLTALLALPGVLQPAQDDQALIAEARPVLIELVNEAVARMNAMRCTEGQTLADDLLKNCNIIQKHIDDIQKRAPRVVEEYHGRLRSRVDELLAKAELDINQGDLIREVAIFADRSDIAEELTRTAGHLDQIQQILGAPDNEPCGRTLDFIAQELLREANTLSSKSNDAQISRHVVVVKSTIDRIKEQVQNVE